MKKKRGRFLNDFTTVMFKFLKTIVLRRKVYNKVFTRPVSPSMDVRTVKPSDSALLPNVGLQTLVGSVVPMGETSLVSIF